MRRDKHRPTPQCLTMLIFSQVTISWYYPLRWASAVESLLSPSVAWELQKSASLNQRKEQTYPLVVDAFNKLCPFPCSWVTIQETLSFLMRLLSIIMVATVIHPYRKAWPCLNMPRRSCVTGQEVGDDLPISTVATGEHGCFSSSSGTAEESSVSLLTR